MKQYSFLTFLLFAFIAGFAQNISVNSTYSQKTVTDESGIVSPIEGVLPGAFSVSATGKVYFSQGNLQYQASFNKWRFAQNQWDIIGNANANISSSYEGWIDLFGWGTSGYDSKYPYLSSTILDDYIKDNIDIAGTEYDWGVYNAISNGGNQAGLWRTLTMEEWKYVFETRNTNSGIRYANACVNGVNGMILLPDDWDTSYYCLNNSNSTGAKYTGNTITASQWIDLERHGAVFLPAAGERIKSLEGPDSNSLPDIDKPDGFSVYLDGVMGFYWSASYCNRISAFGVWFSDSELNPEDWNYRSHGRSVRLVRNAQ